MSTHRHASRLSLLVLALGLSLAASAAPHAEYRVTIVGPPGSQPTAINQSGAVVGIIPTGITTYRSFVNYGRGPIELGLVGGVSNVAVAINDKGEVLGNWFTSEGRPHGYVHYRGKFRYLNDIGGRPTRFVDINNAGYILATNNAPGGSPTYDNPHGFLRSPNGKYRDLGTLPYPDPTTQVHALNNRNQVTGESGTLLPPEIPFYAFVWTKGVMRQLGSFGYTPNYGLDINDRGQVAGYTANENFREARATIWTHGRPTLLDTRPAGDFGYSSATSINNHGHVTGNSDVTGPFIYRGKRLESINSLINPSSGWRITYARVLNDAGQIGADAVRNGVQYAVRLDLIRPHALGTPYIEPEDAPEVDAPEVGE